MILYTVVVYSLYDTHGRDKPSLIRLRHPEAIAVFTTSVMIPWFFDLGCNTTSLMMPLSQPDFFSRHSQERIIRVAFTLSLAGISNWVLQFPNWLFFFKKKLFFPSRNDSSLLFVNNTCFIIFHLSPSLLSHYIYWMHSSMLSDSMNLCLTCSQWVGIHMEKKRFRLKVKEPPQTTITMEEKYCFLHYNNFVCLTLFSW